MPGPCVVFAHDGRTLATLCYPPFSRPHEGWSELRVWDLATGRERRSERRILPARLLTVAGDGERLIVRVVNGGTRPLTDLARWPEQLLLDGRFGAAGCIAVLRPDCRTLATARMRPDHENDTGVRLWDVATGRLVKTLDDGRFVDMLVFSPDGRLLATASRRLAAWDVNTGRVIGWSKATAQCFAPLGFSPDGSALAIQSSGGKLNLLDPADGRVRATFNYIQADAVAFSPDGCQLAVADDERVTVWDLRSLRRIAQFEGHARPQAIERIRQEIDNGVWMLTKRTGVNLVTYRPNFVRSVAFSPDGRLAASCDFDGTARVWETSTGRERLKFTHRADPSWWPLAAAWSWAAAWGCSRSGG